MKSFQSSAALLVLAALVGGCKPANPAAATPADTSQNLAAAKQDASATATDLNNYAYAKKTEFVQAMQADLADLNQQITDLGAKIDQAGADVKTDAQPKLDALHAQADKLKDQIAQVGDATESTWDSVKASTQQAYDNAKKSCNDARQWLSDKLAPAPAAATSTT